MDEDECPHGLGDPVGCLFCKRATRRALLRKADLPGVVVAEAGFDSRCPGCYGSASSTPSDMMGQWRSNSRKFVRGVRGKTVTWLSWEGALDSATIRAEILELPRCPLDLINGTIEEIAEAAAVITGLEVRCLVQWPEFTINDSTYPPSVGMLLF